MLLSDLLGVDLLFEHVRSGLVSARSHPDPTLGLTIFNYTPKCQFERVWDDVTRQCRGLIVHSDQTVVARPWPKFWNYGEVEGEGEALDLDAQVRVTDKLDGSLRCACAWPSGGVDVVVAEGYRPCSTRSVVARTRRC